MQHAPKAMTVYNKMPIVSVFESMEADYAHLCEHVQVWDVACERQVEVIGPDALALVELVTPRDLSRCEVGQCMYAPLADELGGVVNDPIIMRLAQDRFWVSLADSDVMLWLKGIAYGREMNVSVFEPDVSPLAIQGPKADDLMSEILGEQTQDIRFFRFKRVEIADTSLIMARSGWSGQGGFELYLEDSSKGLELWDCIWSSGEKYNIRAGCPNQIDRMETGLQSYGSDMTLADNLMECGLDRFFTLDKPAEYMAREALIAARDNLQRKLVHLVIAGPPLPALRHTWTVCNDAGEAVGYVSSQAYSDRFGGTLSIAMLDIAYTECGQALTVEIDGLAPRSAMVSNQNWGKC
ncbi:MAG: glycine cleavage T C-terminal barrel domain-containing protein, partial [Pseudomonadales bacterium]